MVIIQPFISDYFFEKRARQLALDDKNIIRGCLFLEKKYRHRNSSDFLLYDVNIDGKVYSTMDISISGFPYYAKKFAFESINYWDLLRQGIDVAAEKLALNGVKVKSGGADDAITIRADRVKATKGLSQIPYNQINLSQSVLVQNPGW